MRFTGSLDPASAGDPKNYSVQTWSLKRTEQYGSKHYDQKAAKVSAAHVSADGQSVELEIVDLMPTWCMEIKYKIRAANGVAVNGTVHNTIHRLAE
jgi:hypothetical protein